jgi:hypothetical protein
VATERCSSTPSIRRCALIHIKLPNELVASTHFVLPGSLFRTRSCGSSICRNSGPYGHSVINCGIDRSVLILIKAVSEQVKQKRKGIAFLSFGSFPMSLRTTLRLMNSRSSERSWRNARCPSKTGGTLNWRLQCFLVRENRNSTIGLECQKNPQRSHPDAAICYGPQVRRRT